MIRTICAVLLLGTAMPAFGETLKLASTYDETGTNPDGSKYTGTATVEIISDTTFSIRWKIGSTVYSGFGMRRGDTLAAGRTPCRAGESGLPRKRVQCGIEVGGKIEPPREAAFIICAGSHFGKRIPENSGKGRFVGGKSSRAKNQRAILDTWNRHLRLPHPWLDHADRMI